MSVNKPVKLSSGSDLSYHMVSHTHLTTQTHGVCHGTQRVADGLAAISAFTADGWSAVDAAVGRYSFAV